MTKAEQRTFDRINELLSGLDLSAYGVIDWNLRLGEDVNGYAAAFIRVILADEAWGENWTREKGQPMRQLIHDAFYDAEIEHWPYVSIMTESERREMGELPG